MSSLPTRRPPTTPPARDPHPPSTRTPDSRKGGLEISPGGPPPKRANWLRQQLKRTGAAAAARWRKFDPHLRAYLTGPAPWYAHVLAMVAVVAGLLVAIVLGAQIVAAGVYPRASEQHRSDSSTDGLNSSLIAQSFRSERANLAHIELELSSFRGLPRDGTIRLLQGDGISGKTLVQTPLSTGKFARNAYLDFDFPPIVGSEGVTYTLVLSVPGRPLSSAVGLRYSSVDMLSSGRMYTDAGAQPGDLTIAFRYHYDLWSLLSDVVSVGMGFAWVALCWLVLLWAPGTAVLLWLPNSLSAGQRMLAAPGLSALLYPVFFLLLRSLGVQVGTATLWGVMGACLALILAWVLTRKQLPRPHKPAAVDVAFWGLLAGVSIITLASRLLSLRDLWGGMGLDAYHHTLIAKLFLDNGGIPPNYQPYAPLASFTYHFGFHAQVAVSAWLSGLASAQDVTFLMPLAGQIATTLPVLTLTLFGWKGLGNRWAGLAAGALAALVSVFPAFYVNWSRYTQGLGLAVLPVAWLLLLEALEQPPLNQTPPRSSPRGKRWQAWTRAVRTSSPYMLAVIGAAGLMLTHYRIIIIYAVVALLYLVWRLVKGIRERSPVAVLVVPAWRMSIVAVLAFATLLPWLINLRQNFTSNFLGKQTDAIRNYYDLQQTIGADLLNHYGLAFMLVLSLGGIGWAIKRRDPLPLLPAIAWLLLGLWSNPYLLGGLRLPYAGYLDVTTLVSSAWLPAALLAGYTVAEACRWALSLADAWPGRTRLLWTYSIAALLGVASLVLGLGAGLSLGVMVDSKPYIEQADLTAMSWMKQHMPPTSFVLANPFAFPWDSPPQPVHGSDAGLWVPLLTGGMRSSVPPVPAYNERLTDPLYLQRIREVVAYEPFSDRAPDWAALKREGITDIYVGSRGGALSVPKLLKDDHVSLSFHQDGVYLFHIK